MEKNMKNKKLPLILGCALGAVGIAGGIAMMVYGCSTKQTVLTFNIGDATILSGSAQQSISKDTEFGNINKPEVSKSGCIFEGWYYDSDFKNKVLDTDKISSNTTVYLNMVSDGNCYLEFSATDGGIITGNTKVAIQSGSRFDQINKPSVIWNDGKLFDYWREVGGEKIEETAVITKSTRLESVYTNPIGEKTQLIFETIDSSTYVGTTKFTVPKGTKFQNCTVPTAVKSGKIFNKWQYKQSDGSIVDVPADWAMPSGAIHFYPSFDDVNFNEKITCIIDGTNYWLSNPTASTGDLVFIDTNGNEHKESRSTFNKKITIGNQMAAIDTNFMANCSAFNNGATTTEESIPLIVPASVKLIGDTFLYKCVGFNQQINLTACSDLTKIGASFLHSCALFNSTISMPSTYNNSAFSIGSSFLYGCSEFNQPLTLPSTMTSIPSCFLEGCSKFNQEINFPANVTSIAPYFLSRCDVFNNGGKTLILPSITSINDNFLYSCYDFNVSITFPAGITSIGNYFMYACYDFNQSLSLPSTLTKIGNNFLQKANAFNGDINWSALTNLTTIGSYFMVNCTDFNKSFTIPSNVTSIGKWFMYEISKMVGTITIECPVTAFSSGDAYTLATGMQSNPCYATGITIKGTNATAFKSAFGNSTSNPFRNLI